MKQNKELCLLVVLLLPFLTMAQMHTYHYKRPLSGVNATWHRIVLPEEMFSRLSADLSDVRIYGITLDNDTIETPYLLNIDHTQQKQEDLPFRLINESRQGDVYYFTLENPSENTVNHMLLDFGQMNFDWRVTVEGSQEQQNWYTVAEDYRILSISNKLTDYQFTSLAFPGSRYRFFRLSIRSNEKPRLQKATLSSRKSAPGHYNTYPLNMEITHDKKARQTIVWLTLHQYVPVSYIAIDIRDTFDFYRPFRIEHLSDSIRTEKGWQWIYTPLWSGTLSSLEKNEYLFDHLPAKKIKLIIENHDNIPLEVEDVIVKGARHELIARFTKTADHYLVYGKKNGRKASYDIENFRDQLPSHLTELNIGEEEKIPEQQKTATAPLFEHKGWLWAILGLIILLLGGFTLKMIRN